MVLAAVHRVTFSVLAVPFAVRTYQAFDFARWQSCMLVLTAVLQITGRISHEPS